MLVVPYIYTKDPTNVDVIRIWSGACVYTELHIWSVWDLGVICILRVCDALFFQVVSAAQASAVRGSVFWSEAQYCGGQ